MMAARVWIVETGEYEQRGIWGVYASVEAGVAAIKEDYGPPYIVEWADPDSSAKHLSLVGTFQHVAGYSTAHTASFDFSEYEVIGA